jgi:hypothetical protein
MIMHWFGEGPQTESDARAQDARDRGYDGWLDEDGRAVASRTDGKGRALGFGDKGWSGKGTKDEARAGRAGKGK